MELTETTCVELALMEQQVLDSDLPDALKRKCIRILRDGDRTQREWAVADDEQ